MDYQFGLIGYPVGHSQSPWIHTTFLHLAGLTGTYTLQPVPTGESLKEKVEALKRAGFQGFNVTVPYKQAIIPLLDDITPGAQKLGAVNTVSCRNGRLIGYNTDGAGLLRSLYQYHHTVMQNKDIRVAIIGAGGAARGIYGAFMMEGFTQIDIANRTTERAHSIAEMGNKNTLTKVLTLQELENRLGEYDCVVQTTSVGMSPHENGMIITPKKVKKGCIVSDIVYQPMMTKFLQVTKENGAHIHFGHTMLLYQAQYAFEIWTGHQLDVMEMEDTLQQRLKGEI